MSDVPEYIKEAEHEFVYWATNSPVSCMEASKDKPPERKAKIFESELQYHLGAFTGAQHTCHALYSEGGYDRYYSEAFPPWMEEAVEYQKELQEQIEDQNE